MWPLGVGRPTEDPFGSPSFSAIVMFGLWMWKSMLFTSSSVHILSSSRCGWAISVLPSARTKPRSRTSSDSSHPW